jgi:hypothetical protein
MKIRSVALFVSPLFTCWLGEESRGGTPTPTAAPCGPTLFWQSFDTVLAPKLPAGWVATNKSGNTTKWVTSITVPQAQFLTKDAFIPDQDGLSDKFLDTPGIAITSATAQLSFRNNFNTEHDPPPHEVFWDGGVLEVSSPNINGGAFTDIINPAVGGSFVSGGYTGVIDGTAGNPIAGRKAWSGNSGGDITTVVNLGSKVNGNTIKLRFRMVTDMIVAAPGWHIDKVLITGGPCPSPTPAPTPTPTPTPTPCGITVFSQSFDTVVAPALPAGWTATNTSGNTATWVISTNSPDTTTNNAFISDQDGVSDKVLDTPGIPITSASAQVRFRNNFNTEFSDNTFWDGGVLEVSSPNIKGGAFTDITDPAVGGSFVSGGYTGIISNATQSPLANRMAWSGNSGGYINTVVNLGAKVKNKTIKLRFRMATDQVVGAPGWHIDTVLVVNGCATP